MAILTGEVAKNEIIHSGINALIQLVAFVVGIALVAVFAYQNLP